MKGRILLEKIRDIRPGSNHYRGRRQSILFVRNS